MVGFSRLQLNSLMAMAPGSALSVLSHTRLFEAGLLLSNLRKMSCVAACADRGMASSMVSAASAATAQARSEVVMDMGPSLAMWTTTR